MRDESDQVAPATATTDASQHQALAKRDVFLVEDNEIQRLHVTATLQNFGFQVQAFASPEPLTEALAETRPAAIIMDIMIGDGRVSANASDNGSHFDPSLVAKFNEVFPELLAIRSQYSDQPRKEVVPSAAGVPRREPGPSGVQRLHSEAANLVAAP